MNMNLLSGINWVAVFVAAIAYFMLGALWYSFLFQKPWVRLQKVDMNAPDARKGVAGIMVSSFLLMLLATIGLAFLVERMQLHQLISGIKIGLLTGICFSLATISIGYLYTKKPLGLHLIDGLYHTTGQIIAAIILCLWK
ncbi:MAG: DUF1761 domain-containing protein [Bacteroidota bacterium]|nr:DUF1761 domain-containing protein [Flavisolibacter sp.]MBD0377809.1 DUF1761 domain-containing protein [Flavisolibacter sp.]MDQ3844594.1 DUF1761 domain-containing protein [Bacteroidota bacterium]